MADALAAAGTAMFDDVLMAQKVQLSRSLGAENSTGYQCSYDDTVSMLLIIILNLYVYTLYTLYIYIHMYIYIL